MLLALEDRPAQRQRHRSKTRAARDQDILAMYGFVRPERRGQQVLAGIKAFAARHYIRHGYGRMISMVRASNTPSIRAHANLGAASQFVVTRFRLGSLMIVWYRSTISIGRAGRQFSIVV